jgi:hypothetical protein
MPNRVQPGRHISVKRVAFHLDVPSIELRLGIFDFRGYV